MRLFWPIYLVIALVSVLAVWFIAPSFRESVPENLRSDWAHYAAKIKGEDLEGMERQYDERMEADRIARMAAEAASAAASSPKPSARTSPAAPRTVVPAARRSVVRRDPAAPDDDSGEEEVSVPSSSGSGGSSDQESYNPPPATRGILHADFKDAEWGIVNAVTPYKSLADGGELGNAGIGAVFVIEQRQPAEGGGMEFVGNFCNQPVEEPVVIPASRLFCFTGSYESLTSRQKAALTAYYKKRAESERIKRDIARENGARSPFFANAVDAKAKWDEMVNTAKSLEVALRTDAKANASQIRDKLARMKGEMAVQQAKVKELSAKHKEWKEKNAPQMTDPEDDPRVRKLRDEMQELAQTIPGLAF